MGAANPPASTSFGPFFSFPIYCWNGYLYSTYVGSTALDIITTVIEQHICVGVFGMVLVIAELIPQELLASLFILRLSITLRNAMVLCEYHHPTSTGNCNLTWNSPLAAGNSFGAGNYAGITSDHIINGRADGYGGCSRADYFPRIGSTELRNLSLALHYNLLQFGLCQSPSSMRQA